MKKQYRYSCPHKSNKYICKICNPKAFCEAHGRNKSQCKECGGGSICQHGKRRNVCKLGCGGGSICPCGKERIKCNECGGSQICPCGRLKIQCKNCGGSQICPCGKQKSQCRKCNGNSFCKAHGIRKNLCKECGGASYCIKHPNTLKNICIPCGGSDICIHKKQRKICNICEPQKYLVHLQRNRLRKIFTMKNLEKTKHTIEYLGCTEQEFYDHIIKQMIPGMTFDNIHLDHIKPISKWNLEDEEELRKCCHYTNIQPLFAEDNLSKSDKWDDY